MHAVICWVHTCAGVVYTKLSSRMMRDAKSALQQTQHAGQQSTHAAHISSATAFALEPGAVNPPLLANPLHASGHLMFDAPCLAWVTSWCGVNSLCCRGTAPRYQRLCRPSCRREALRLALRVHALLP